MSSLGPKKPPLSSDDEDNAGSAPHLITVVSISTV
jgi:hypothetical protein